MNVKKLMGVVNHANFVSVTEGLLYIPCISLLHSHITSPSSNLKFHILG